MRVGQSRSGEEIAALDKRLGPVKRVLNQVTRVNSGIKVDLKWTANIALKVIPNAPKISDGAIISITTETWVDRINSVLHLRSNDIQINYDGKMVPLNIYINNNGYTMERVASPSYYSIFKGTWK